VQPIASFASRGAASGNILAKLLLSCLIKIEDTGLEVVGVVCDGATTNKAFWKIFDITGKQNCIKNKVHTRNILSYSFTPNLFHFDPVHY